MLTADALGPGMPDDFKAMGAPFRQDMVFGNHDPDRGGSGNFFDQKVDLDTDAIKFIKDQTGLPVVVKGLLRGDDADRSIGAGADAIQVSNHGGRQINGVPASIAALPDVAEAVNRRVPVILDSGTLPNSRELVKLGYSKNPSGRLRDQLARDKDMPCKILKTVPLETGQQAIRFEKRLHAKLRKAYPAAVVDRKVFHGHINVKSEIYDVSMTDVILAELDAIAAQTAPMAS